MSSPSKPRVTSPRERTAVDVSGSDAAITVVVPNSHPSAPRVLVFDLDSGRGLSLAASLRRLPHEIVVSVTNARGTGPDGAGEQLDVALVSLADARFDGLAFGAELGATFPWIEIVYWFEEGGAAPLAAAARSVGVRRMIPLTRLFGWLDGALPSLARMARARHEHLSAERMLPPLPSPDDWNRRRRASAASSGAAVPGGLPSTAALAIRQPHDRRAARGCALHDLLFDAEEARSRVNTLANFRRKALRTAGWRPTGISLESRSCSPCIDVGCETMRMAPYASTLLLAATLIACGAWACSSSSSSPDGGGGAGAGGGRIRWRRRSRRQRGHRRRCGLLPDRATGVQLDDSGNREREPLGLRTDLGRISAIRGRRLRELRHPAADVLLSGRLRSSLSITARADATGAICHADHRSLSSPAVRALDLRPGGVRVEQSGRYRNRRRGR